MIQTLKHFTSGESLFSATSALMEKLHIVFDRETAQPINVADLYDGPMPQYLTNALQSIEHTYFIGYVNDQSLSGEKSNLSLEEHQKLNAKYSFMTVFACDAKSGIHLTRTMAAALTRGFNRMSDGAPLILVIRQDNFLSIATCERTDRKDGGEKLGKVTMLRNINCEQVHAGHRQILDQVADNVKGSTTFDELYSKWLTSFSIDVLSDAFFDGYKTIYEDIIEYVTGKRMVKEGSKWVEKDNNTPCTEIMAEFASFANPEKTVRDYVKKLMGRLVFIQFLQRKGWMGVPAGDSWKGGDPEFMQNLFANSDKKDTFIDDVLEPLFNDLNTNRHGDLLTLDRTIKVPYLNGGLFELDETDDTTFALPSRFLKKLFDFFASYNFTIDENAPDNVEIGVDPEMLGRIFENLLEDNKEKGAFYTPKEIVQYMCRESLIAYLTTCVMKKQGEEHQPEKEIRDAVRKLLAEPEVIVPKMSHENLADFGEYIREVKICDPAIGSGAFPMGLLNELVHCRAIIGAWAKDAYDNLLVGDYAALKAEIICNNIYGVDIEKGAIDIARLRFWLSIIVDLKVPHALPNFDYKFMQGNSLITTFNGEYVNLDTKNQKHVKVTYMIKEKNNLYALKQKYYAAQGVQKHELAVEIKKSILRLVSMQIGYELRSWYEKNVVTQGTFGFDGQKADFADIKSLLPQDKQDLVNHANALYKQLSDTNVDVAKRALIDISFFDWRIMFTEVFDGDNGGFDIVIGNPPYINVELIPEEDKYIFRKVFKCFFKRADMFVLFLENSLLKLTNTNAITSFIIPSVIHSNLSYQPFRDIILENKWLREVCYTGGKVFNAPTVDTTILICCKYGNKDIVLKNAVDFSNHISYSVASDYFSMFKNVISIGSKDTDAIFGKLFKPDFPVLDDLFTIYQGIVTGNNPAFIFETMDDAIAQNIDTELLHPMCHGRDIERYAVRSRERQMLYLNNSHDIEQYPNTHNWLLDFRESLVERREVRKGTIKWYCLQWPRIQSELDTKEKLLIQNTRNESLKVRIVATLDDKGVYGTQGLNFVIPKDNEYSLRYLLGVLNSKLMNFLFSTKFLNLAIKADFLKQVHIPNAEKQEQEYLGDIVNNILLEKNNDLDSDTSQYEERIDRLVYELYGLTNAEVRIIDPNITTTGADDELFKAE